MLETHARVSAGDVVLVQGASGGFGRAIGELGSRLGLRMYGTASAAGVDAVTANGATFVENRSQDYAAVLRDRDAAQRSAACRGGREPIMTGTALRYVGCCSSAMLGQRTGRWRKVTPAPARSS